LLNIVFVFATNLAIASIHTMSGVMWYERHLNYKEERK